MEIRGTVLDEFIRILAERAEKMPDSRTGKNTQYKMTDFVMSAFSIFFMQSASFIEGQRRLREATGKDNLKTLFGIEKIPEDTQIRKQLDEIKPEEIYPVWEEMYKYLEKKGLLKQFTGYDGNYLIAVDGTVYQSSEKIHCKRCSSRTKDGKTRYYHYVLSPALVQSGAKKNKVIAMEPEYIEPQDGKEKQDCEQAALKRWLEKHGTKYSGKATILGDALYANETICRELLSKKLDFILTCKAGSNKYLFNEAVKYYEDNGELPEVQIRKWNGKYGEIYIYRYANDLCIKDPMYNRGEILHVNWCDLTIVREDTLEETFYNSYITNFPINDQNVADIVQDGRSRWSVENGSYNILKNYGYHGEHNFGHGDNYLG